MQNRIRRLLLIAALTEAFIACNCFAVTHNEDDSPPITITAWEKSAEPNRWIANVGEEHNRGTLEVVILDKSIVFIMKRTCIGSQNIEMISWGLGDSIGKWITCENFEKVSFMPSLIEKAMKPLPEEVQNFFKWYKQPPPRTLVIKVV